MKNKFKFIGSIALAATIGLGALSFAGCTENNVDVYDSKEGYIVLKEADHMYRLHR